ncbi:holin [Citrobacter braakii]|nr:holin [Citrobacter braakii]
MFMLKPNDIQIMTWLTVGIFSTWGGIVRYLLDVREKKVRLNWFGAMAQVVVSAFTGLLGGLLVFEAGGSNYMSFVVSGLFGMSGSAGLDYLYARILSKKSP